MLQSIRSAKEKAGSDDTANTVDESLYEKGKKVLDKMHLIMAICLFLS
jgi:hypothetical protein